MPSYVTPKKNTAFVTYVSLEDQANPGLFKASPTLAAGDVLVATDDGAPGNAATLPTVDADFTKRVKVSLSAGEMNGDNVTVIFSDAAGAEWYDLTLNIQTSAQQVDDLAAPGDQMDLVNAPNATAVTAIQAGLATTGADGDTLETLSDQIDGIDVNGTAAAVWAYTPRTLTQTAAAVASVMAGTSLTITRGDTLSATLTGLGNITGYANLWFTVKWATSDLDAAAIIQIDTDTGLLTVNGAAATAGNGSITVDDATAGDITIGIDEAATAWLVPATGYVYDVQVLRSTGAVNTLTSGLLTVAADVTRAVA